jgi:hypothetical protein
MHDDADDVAVPSATTTSAPAGRRVDAVAQHEVGVVQRLRIAKADAEMLQRDGFASIVCDGLLTTTIGPGRRAPP